MKHVYGIAGALMCAAGLCALVPAGENPATDSGKKAVSEKLLFGFERAEAEAAVLYDDHEFRIGCGPRVAPAELAPVPAPAAPSSETAVTEVRTSVIPIQELVRKGCLKDEPQNTGAHSSIRLSCVAAPDPEHIAVGFYMYGTATVRATSISSRRTGKPSSGAVATRDGGVTWGGLDGTEWPSLMGRVHLRDLGADVMGAWEFGCYMVRGAHIGYPVDRIFFTRSAFDGAAWHEFSLPAQQEKRGCLTAGPDGTMVFFGRDAAQKKLLCWKKKPAGKWEGPEEVASEKTRIMQLACPRYSPKGFTAVAYMCLTADADGKKSGEPFTRETPGFKYYWGKPAEKLFWEFPSRHWEFEPWIKVVTVPAP